ncbi:holo-ACP synthase [Rhodanobacter sp. C03]|uniref:holo-ACP synthase n=1 Tax=Rhodanobacter sp. C03 TaxID=1945858 RepID=UPI0009845096|nr:holo-ACP synthase [Rhodanobacter sp. C03]OOG53695.1 holo-[acyl-carrier-protein] synthase [Rhodanobacter sp. C03]
MGESSNIRVGIDLVRISAIAESLASFGDRFLHRVFTEAEVTYCMSAPMLVSSRLAVRFAAKEATRKALRLDGVGWRDIEVVRQPDGACDIELHGATMAKCGAGRLALSMSHEGDHATAVVIADRNRQ